jgi:hypothetical protein
MDHAEKAFPDGLAFLQVYNLLLLPESLYRYAHDGTPDYVPQLALTVLSADRSKCEGLLGTIVWDGKTVPQSLAQVFSAGFCKGMHEYYMAKTIGIAWELDRELMRRHGLEYGLWWLTFSKEKIEQSKRMRLTAEGKIEESPDEQKPPSLGDYLDSDATYLYLSELFAEIEANVSR